MHNSSMLRMKWFVDNFVSKVHKEKIRVLDVGSYDVNGSYTKLFSGKKYTYVGLDMEKGPNVDIVLKKPYDWSNIPTDSYDVVISGQAFEHMEFFWVVLSEMVRVLKKDGLLCIIAPSASGEHRYPVDCYRFFTDGMAALARYTNLEILHVHTNSAPGKNLNWYDLSNADSMLVAKKNYEGNTKILNLKKYNCVPLDQKKFRGGMISYNQLSLFKKIFLKCNRIIHIIKILPGYIKNKIIR